MPTNKSTEKITIWCCDNCDIFEVTKKLTKFEMMILGLVDTIILISILASSGVPNVRHIAIICGATFAYLLYLSVELYGLHKRKNRIIVFGSIVRCLQSITIFTFMFVIPLLGLDGFNHFLQVNFKITGILGSL